MYKRQVLLLPLLTLLLSPSLPPPTLLLAPPPPPPPLQLLLAQMNPLPEIRHAGRFPLFSLLYWRGGKEGRGGNWRCEPRAEGSLLL